MMEAGNFGHRSVNGEKGITRSSIRNRAVSEVQYETASTDSSSDDGCELKNSRLADARRSMFPFVSVFDIKSIQKLFKEHKIKLDHAFKVWRYIVQKGCEDISQIPYIPKAASRVLKEYCILTTTKVVQRQDSKDGSTTKLLIELQDGKHVEFVIMRYGQVELSMYPEDRLKSGTFRSQPRATVCVSSQVGCGMGCRFCATGTMGLLANLTSGEILEQLYHASRIETIRNVVFMGMGEPLDNYNEVIDSIKLMTDVRVFNLSSNRISLSTVGVVPRIKQLQRDAPNVSLALSLHAPTQDIREKIVPTAKTWKFSGILEAALDFVKAQKKKSGKHRKYQGLLLEYVLIQNINSDPSTAHRTGQLLSPHSNFVVLNVIPYNPTIRNETMKRPTDGEIDTFIEIVRSYGVRVLIRQTLGQDISSACGQLMVENQQQKSICDVEDLLQHTSAGLPLSTASATIEQRNETNSVTSFSETMSLFKKLASRFRHPAGTEQLIMTTAVIVLGVLVFRCCKCRKK